MNINVLTTTFYKSRSETRFHLACQLIGNTVGAGYDVLVVDGSPDPAVGQALKKIGANVHPQKTQSMGGSRRELFRLAVNANNGWQPGIFVWTEPEKVDIVRSIPKITAPLECSEADIVIPSRTQGSWESYPGFQVVSEQKANATYLEVTGKSFDPMFGPVAFSSKVAECFALCNPTEQFGATDGYIQHFAPLTAMKEGYKVISVPVDFYYPLVQRVEEESGFREEMLKKREAQLSQLATGYRLAAKSLGLPACA